MFIRFRSRPAPREIVCLLLAIGFHLSVPGGAADRSLRVLRTQSAIQLDGVLDESPWLEAQAISNFTQQEPSVDQPATEKTEVRAVLGEDALYLGVRCYDSEPSKIIARERRRDNRLFDDDRFEIVLDTFHDHRSAFHFVTNPLGTRFDALVRDEGADVNSEWDETWQVATQIDERGWTLEIEIPLTTLRAPRDLDTWGINFLRFIRRKNELAQWSGWSRDFTFVQVSQAGHLEGMRGAKAGVTARIKPYVLGGARRIGLTQMGSESEGVFELGLEVAKVGLTPSLVAEFTVNTDFAQVEVDRAIVNLTRFPTFFPERREFFLEQAGIFEFSRTGRRGGSTSSVLLDMYFTRRIGLSSDRRPLPILAGGKVTGRMGDFDTGFLNVQTDDFEGSPGSNYTVFRLKRNILARSNLGIFASNRQSGEPNDSNRVVGADLNLTFFNNVDLQGSLGRSFTEGVAGDQMMGRTKFNWFTETHEVYVEHLYIGDEFRHDIGFVRRSGVRRSEGIFTWDPRPKGLNIRRLAFKGQIAYLTDTDNRLLTRKQELQLNAHFHSGANMTFNTRHDFEQLEGDFEITPGITIPLAAYGFRTNFVRYRFPPQKILSAATGFGWGDFWSGKRKFLQFSPSFRPWPEFSAQVTYEYNDVDLPQGNFVTHLINSRLNINLSNRWLTTSLVQYESESERLVLFFRLRFIYRPGDDLYVVFNQTSRLGSLESEADRSFLVKLTHSFDF